MSRININIGLILSFVVQNVFLLQSNINLINPYHMKTSTFSAMVKQLSVMLLAALFMSLNMFASTLSRVETFNPAEFSISTSEVAGMQYSVLKLGDCLPPVNPDHRCC